MCARLPFLCAVLAASASAQIPNSASPAMVIPHGLVTAGSPPSPVLVTGPTFATTPPPVAAPVLPGTPDFGASLSGLLGGIEIDAMSVGFDLILAKATPPDRGIVEVPPGSWGAITFSVTPGTPGAAGSIVAFAAAEPDGAAADVFCYTLPGGVMPPDLADRTFRAQDSREMNLVSPADPTPDMVAHDVYIGLVYTSNPQTLSTFPSPPAFYFSVAPGSVAAVPPGWWQATPPSAATILVTTWDAGVWTPPAPFRTFASLGLLQGDDIDALAVEASSGEILFSTALGNGLDQILYANGALAGNVTYRLPTGTPISARTGIGSVGVADVDGICALDPGPGPLGGHRQLRRLMGHAVARCLSTPQELGVSMFRRMLTPATEELVLWMAGWPPGGPSAHQTFAVVNVSFAPSCLSGLLTPGGGVFSRPCLCLPWHGADGHPERFSIPIPPALSGSGAQIWFHWAAIDLQNLTLNVAHGLGVTL